MIYKISFVDRAKEDLAYLKACEPNCFKKAVKLLNELAEHPKQELDNLNNSEVIGQDNGAVVFQKKHRLVYEIRDLEVIVLVLSAYGHYNDK